MTRLFSGLLLTTLFSLFLLGGLLDFIASSDDQDGGSQTLLAGRLLDYLEHATHDLSAEALTPFIRQQAEKLQLPLTLVPQADLLLPAELKQQLDQPGGLMLASVDNTLMFKRLANHPDVLLKLALDAEEPHHPFALWLTLGLYGGMALLLLLWLIPLMRRLSMLTQLAERFGMGDHQVRMPASRLSYIPQLEQRFNRMADQISQLIRENQVLASSLSHDLRTPISCFRFGLDAALDASTPQQKDQFLLRLEQDLERMETMVNSFLEYASLSRTALTLKYHRLDLADWLRATAETCLPLLHNRNITLHLNIPASAIHSRVNGFWLERAVINVVSNAQRYARQEILITLQQEADQWVIRISDDGPGVEADDIERILQPFVRLALAEPADTPTPHYGLGLAIAAQVLKWHGGNIAVGRCPMLGGACFRLTLPFTD